MTKKLIEVIGVDRILLTMICRVTNKSNGQRAGPSRRSWRKSKGEERTPDKYEVMEGKGKGFPRRQGPPSGSTSKHWLAT